MAGSICLGVAALVLAGSPMWGFEFALLVSMGLGTLAAQFFCAPLLAAMAIRHQRQIARQTQISEKDALRLAELSAIPTSAG
jgi:preprotein translocase subunit SecF